MLSGAWCDIGSSPVQDQELDLNYPGKFTGEFLPAQNKLWFCGAIEQLLST